MSPKKIIFFIIVGVITITLIIGIFLLQKKTTKETIIPGNIRVWISEGNTQSYDSLIEGFKLYAPEYADSTITFEKKTTDPIRYRILLLSTMSEGTGPDIFMVGAGTDVVLESKIEPIPESVINFSNFEKEYDDVFLPLIVSSGSKDTFTRYLMGVPLGFETLGIFYNKNLVREVPITWNALDVLYSNGISPEVFPANLGLGPRYTQNAADIVGLFYGRAGMYDATNLRGGDGEGLASYLSYKDIRIASAGSDDAFAPIVTLDGKKEEMDTESLTTLDLFMQGDIGMVFGYPSLITELEKSDKRVGFKSKAGNILTERIPADSPTEGRENAAKYNFFALSKATKEPETAVKFLEYLLTPDAQKRFLQNNPYLISAQRSFWPAQESSVLSNVLNRATLGAFIPEIDEELFVFSYGLKAEFENFLSEYIDRNDNIDINKISELISHNISCSIDTYSGKETRADCENK